MFPGIDVYDDLLPAETHDWISRQLSDGNFPWYWHADTYGAPRSEAQDSRVFEADQFGHIFYQRDSGVNSDWFTIVETVLRAVGQSRSCDFDLIRAKANLLMPSIGQGDFNTPHRDMQEPHLVVLYYVLDSDGDTVFFSTDSDPWIESHRIVPKANRAVVFDGMTYHASRHPRQHARRMVLNFDVRAVVSSH